MKPAPDKIQPPKAGGLVPLPTDRLISLGELTNATAAVVEQNDRSYRIVDHQTPGAIGHHSPRDAAKGMHRVALMAALDAGTVTARSLQTRVPYGELGRIDSNWDRTSLSYGLTYADAAKFCEQLALEARPIDELSDPIPTAANKLPAAGDSVLKRAALVRKLSGKWPTIDRDLRDAVQNGLKQAAGADQRGFWHEERALAWAHQRGKVLNSSALDTSANSVFSQPGTVHRIKG